MADKTYNYTARYVASTPRNKRLTDSIASASQSGGTSYIGPSAPQYWELVTTDSSGNPLDESAYYLQPVQGESVVVPGDVVAQSVTDVSGVLPVAADYTTTGLYKAKSGGGLLYGTEGWYVDPSYAGSGGTDVSWGTATSNYAPLTVGNQSKNVSLYGHTHSEYLTGLSLSTSGSGGLVTNVSVSGSTITQTKSDLTLSQWQAATNVEGYKYIGQSGGGYDIIFRERGNFYQGANFGETPTINGVSMDNWYVTVDTAQTVTGAKKFTAVTHIGPTNNVHILLGKNSGNVINGVNTNDAIANLYFNYTSGTQYTKIDATNNLTTTGDVVAMSTGTAVSSLPTASSSNFGLVKIDNSTIKLNSSNQLYCTVQGGSGSGSTVSISGLLSSGTTIGTLTIDGTSYTLRAPTSSSGGGTTVSWGTATSNYAPLTVGNQSKNISLNGHTHSEYAAASHTHNYSKVSISGLLSSGTTIGTLTIDGTAYTLRAAAASGSTTSVNGLSGGTISGNVTVGGANYGYLAVKGSTHSWYMHIRDASSSGYGLYWGYDGTNDHRMSLSYTGNLWIYGSFSQSSDERLKSIVGEVGGVLSHIEDVRVVEYYLNDDPEQAHQIGFIAQDVLPYWSANVGEVNDRYTLNYGGMGAVAFQGVKELYGLVKALQAEVAALRGELALLKGGEG